MQDKDQLIRLLIIKGVCKLIEKNRIQPSLDFIARLFLMAFDKEYSNIDIKDKSSVKW
jgi:hypothetical protein